jgi:heme/copper-type cytochrome/quinol oxidase subunit 2
VDSNGEPQLDTRTITVTKGDTLKLTVGNRTDSQQEFKIDGADVSESVPPDQAVTVEFKAEAPGVYRLYSDADPGVDPLSIVVPA